MSTVAASAILSPVSDQYLDGFPHHFGVKLGGRQHESDDQPLQVLRQLRLEVLHQVLERQKDYSHNRSAHNTER